MPKGYRSYLPEQELLLPPSLREWLPENHLVYFVSDIVDQLDLSAIHAVYEKEKRGQPPYDPRLMTKLLVYGYCTGVFGSRRIQKRLREDIPFRVLAARNEPDFRTIADFRKIHIATLENLFEQVLAMALECGAIQLGRVSLDGTKLKANASKHRAMSYGRDEGKATATEGRSEAVAGCGRGGRRGGRLSVRQPARRRVSGRTAAARVSAGQDQGSQESPRATRAGQGGRGRQERRRGQAGGQGSIQLLRSGVAHHERRRRHCAGLQCASGGGADFAADRRAIGDGSSQ